MNLILSSLRATFHFYYTPSATKNVGSGHAYHWEKGQGTDYFICPMVPGIRRVRNCRGETHPTEKPVRLFTDWLLRWWGDREKPILDPFCGSGTILVAAKQLGFRYIVGGDIDPVWVNAARKRLEEFTEQKNHNDFTQFLY